MDEHISHSQYFILEQNDDNSIDVAFRSLHLGEPREQEKEIPEGSEDLVRIMFYSRTQNSLRDAARELNALLEQVMEYRDAPPSLTVTQTYLPGTMVQLMQSRERAKRLYRNALDINFRDLVEWNYLEKLSNELQEELCRTDEFLALYSGRGAYH